MPKIRVKSYDYGEKITTVDEHELRLVKDFLNAINKCNGIDLDDYQLIFKMNKEETIQFLNEDLEFIKSLIPESYGYSSVDTISIIPDEEKVIFRQSDFFKS